MPRTWPPRLPRWTIRRAMGMFVLIAFVLGLCLPAIEVYREKDWHIHGFITPCSDVSISNFEPMTLPYWTRYRRRLAGWYSREPSSCGIDAGRPAETCEFGSPEMTASTPGVSGPALILNYRPPDAPTPRYRSTKRMSEESLKNLGRAGVPGVEQLPKSEEMSPSSP